MGIIEFDTIQVESLKCTPCTKRNALWSISWLLYSSAFMHICKQALTERSRLLDKWPVSAYSTFCKVAVVLRASLASHTESSRVHGEVNHAGTGIISL